VNNVYENEEMNINPPEKVEIEKVLRSILSDKPRITKFNINWDTEDTNSIPTFNNYNYMFDEGKKTSENIYNNFFNNSVSINNEQNTKNEIDSKNC
jgi:hypothetical protein